MMKKFQFVSVSLCAILTLPLLAKAENYALSADGLAVVRLTPTESIKATSFDSNLLTPGWTAVVAEPSTGSLAVTKYQAGFQKGFGGGEIEALYDHHVPLGDKQSLEWVQVINTNVPLDGSSTTYLDNKARPSAPFYSFTQENRSPWLPAEQLNFYDFSKRSPASLLTTDTVSWQAKLYPVVWDGQKNIVLQDGVNWGWTMKKATVGSASATFISPAPDNAVTTGVGTSGFTWGSSNPSSLSFAPAGFDTTPNTAFKLGRLTFHNGSIPLGSEANSVYMDIAIAFNNVPEKNFTLHTPLILTNTLNTNDPIASADQVSLAEWGYTFNVLEGETASVDIMAELTTGLELKPSGTVSGAAIKNDLPLDASPSYKLKIVGLANPSAGGFVSTVPEVSTWLLMLIGLGYVIVRMRMRPAMEGC